MKLTDKCLIFEPGYTGHRGEFVRHLMQFINDNPGLHGKYIFTLDERFAPLVESLTVPNNFEVVYNTFDGKPKNSLKRSFWVWDRISAILAERKDIGEIIFLELDPYLILINTKRFRKFKLSVKGILFQPYNHFKASIKDLLKKYLIQKTVFSLHPAIDTCFILNDKESVARMNKKIKNIFCFLPDPIDDAVPVVDPVTAGKITAKYRIEKGRKVLLLFGTIDERKNLINIIDAMRLFPDEAKTKFSLIIAGKFKAEVRDRYTQYIDRYKDELNIVYYDAFVSDQERAVIFQHCDVVLMPYANFYSSSGVLGHATHYGKRVIVSSLGLLKNIVTEYGMGIAVDPLSAKSIHRATHELLFGNECPEYDNRKFVAEHSPAIFSKTLLKA